ncbi:MAG: gliding motility protein GldL [Bacteroidetes bacterium]|jgi:gliding motility-associated protein GldL|nr:gliding motility protein GldL [Bacteroidota bacterium]MBT6687033.1 gliding motility protein GldL [Bacteroidota bacterium]MBT7492552.1 gliding motility protein GldL [Bacteroidota bacterium]
MLNISEIVQGKAWKNGMAKLYGWGAAVVILGALFKINHYPYASEMLLVGLGTEALIFFFSAFEPLHVEYDWSLVYPELAGMGFDEEFESERGMKGSGSLADAILEKADIGQDVFEKLGEGLRNLSETASMMSDVSDASVATKEYVTNVTSASESMSTLSESSIQTAEIVTKSGESYQQLADKISTDFSTVTSSGEMYGQQIEKMNKSLSSLNSVYELQLKGSDEHMKISQQVYSGLGKMMTNLNDSVENTQKYKEEISKLGEKLESLNTVYGNMLSAMNIK